MEETYQEVSMKFYDFMKRMFFGVVKKYGGNVDNDGQELLKNAV